MPLYDTSLPNTQWNSVNAGVIPEDVFGVAINWFINRTPLVSRLPKPSVGSASFKITNDNYRPRSVPLGTSYTSGGGSLVFTDATSFTVGDVLQADSELLLVTAVASNTTLTVTGAYAGTAAANHTAPVPVYLITNTRTGAEIDVTGISRTPTAVTQLCQTVQHAYQVGGALQADTNYYGGMITPLARDRMLAMQHAMDDFESACYYGKGVALAAAGTRPLMKGIQTLLVTNNTATPTNATAYKPSGSGARHDAELVRRRRQPQPDAGQPRLHDRHGGVGPRGSAAPGRGDRLRHAHRPLRGPVPVGDLDHRGPAPAAGHGHLSVQSRGPHPHEAGDDRQAARLAG